MRVYRYTVLFLIMLLCTAFVCGRVRAEETFYERAQLEAFLRDQRPAELNFSCSAELYGELQPDGFRELFRLLARAGIDHSGAEVSYNDLFRHIGLRSLVYTDRPWAEVSVLSELGPALQGIPREGTDFVLLCPGGMVEQLVSGQTLRNAAAKAGVRSFASVYSADTGILRMTGIEFFDVPGADAEDYAQFAAAVSRFADENIQDFYIVFTPELFAAVTGDPAEMTAMLGSSRIGAYSAEIDPNSCVIHFMQTEFTDAPREICRSVSDVREAIRRMGALGIRDFELIFPYTDVFDTLYVDDFAGLLTVRTEAGMVRGDVSYSSGHDRIIFRNAEIVSDVQALTNLAEANAFAEAQADSGNRDIHLFCTPELYRLLTEVPVRDGTARKSLTRMYDLVSHAGIFDYTITTSEATGLISIRVSRLFPGRAVMLAVRSGDTGGLSERERLTWQAAAAAADTVRTGDPLQTAKGVHDWLCSRVTYADDAFTDEDDTAVGAILNGRANCDGYADAFYLIAGLAGLDVRYQHGDSLDKNDPSDPASVSHLWNLLEIGGVWRMVDVTWDDDDSGWSYIWFNAGRDVAARMHVWNEDMTVPIAAESDHPFNIGSDFYVRDRDEMLAAVRTAAERGLVWFHIVFECPDAELLAEEARRAVMDRSGRTISYSWNDKMSALGFFDLQW